MVIALIPQSDSSFNMRSHNFICSQKPVCLEFVHFALYQIFPVYLSPFVCPILNYRYSWPRTLPIKSNLFSLYSPLPQYEDVLQTVSSDILFAARKEKDILLCKYKKKIQMYCDLHVFEENR